MRWRTWIIGLLLPLITACSMLRVAYSQAQDLAYWWLDGYVDFSPEQTPKVRVALGELLAWHRSTQLSDYIALLSSLRDQAGAAITADQACAQADALRQRLDTAFERALPVLADLTRTLSPKQLQHLSARYAKGNAEFRDDYLKGDAAARLQASVKRALERSESYYGRFDAAQRDLLAQGVAASPFDPEAWLAERQALQQEVLATLRRLIDQGADAASVQAAWRALAARQMQSPRPDYRAYQQRLLTHNCALFARLHNATTAQQRQRAADRLKGWEDDLRALAAS